MISLIICANTNASENPLTNNEPLDKAVTRSFGQLEEPENRNIQHGRSFQSGQMAYYFGDYAKAVEHWQPLAEQGHVEAQANLGWFYQMGLGVKTDLAVAFSWYQKAAKAGQAVAQNNLGVMYEQGLHVAKDNQQAVHWYQQSAKNGYRFGQYNYAQQLDRQQQTDKANHWYIAAARQQVEAAIAILKQRNIQNWKTE